MSTTNQSATAIAEELGGRLKQARLDQDLTQADLAQRVGITRKALLQAEKGQAQLATFIAIMVALNLTEQLDLFLPKPAISPLQLAKLQGKQQGKQRQRASRQRTNRDEETAKGDIAEVEANLRLTL